MAGCLVLSSGYAGAVAASMRRLVRVLTTYSRKPWERSSNSGRSGRKGRHILSTVDGVEVTVEHVAAIEQTEMLRADYGMAQKNSNASRRLRRNWTGARRYANLYFTPPRRDRFMLPAAPRPGQGSKSCGGQEAPTFQRSVVTAQQISAW